MYLPPSGGAPSSKHLLIETEDASPQGGALGKDGLDGQEDDGTDDSKDYARGDPPPQDNTISQSTYTKIQLGK